MVRRIAAAIASFVVVCSVVASAQEPKLTPDQQQFVDNMMGPRVLDPNLRVTALKLESTPVRDVLASVEKMTGLVVRYDKTVPEADARINVNIVTASLKDALDLVLGANKLAYKVVGAKQILVYSEANRAKYTESIKTFWLTKADPAVVISSLNLGFRAGDGPRPMFISSAGSRGITVKANAGQMAEIAKIIAEMDK